MEIFYVSFATLTLLGCESLGEDEGSLYVIDTFPVKL
jgi:hypothetical protein